MFNNLKNEVYFTYAVGKDKVTLVNVGENYGVAYFNGEGRFDPIIGVSLAALRAMHAAVMDRKDQPLINTNMGMHYGKLNNAIKHLLSYTAFVSATTATGQKSRRIAEYEYVARNINRLNADIILASPKPPNQNSIKYLAPRIAMKHVSSGKNVSSYYVFRDDIEGIFPDAHIPETLHAVIIRMATISTLNAYEYKYDV